MSNHILVSGLINLETTLKCDGFPLDYAPVRYPFFGVHSTISGVGYNLARALTTLGTNVDFLSLIGRDLAGDAAHATLQNLNIPTSYVLRQLEQTPQSVIMFEPSGRRAINVDLKDIQEQVYPIELFETALANCSLAALCNINFSRPFLFRALQAGKMIATDVHVIRDLEDEYNRDFMKYAHILSMSNEGLPCPPEEWARRLQDRYGTAIILIGLGAEGALLAVKADHFMERIPAVFTREVVNTVGAGDALFSAFIHTYNQTHDPYLAIRKAMVFASYKIGSNGGAEGFLTQADLDEWVEKAYRKEH